MFPVPRFLVDTSVWKKNKHVQVRPWFDQAALDGEIAICDQITAERAGLILVHYDQDFDDIAGVTAQVTQWVGPCGQL